jgi:hypothetical protein
MSTPDPDPRTVSAEISSLPPLPPPTRRFWVENIYARADHPLGPGPHSGYFPDDFCAQKKGR